MFSTTVMFHVQNILEHIFLQQIFWTATVHPTFFTTLSQYRRFKRFECNCSSHSWNSRFKFYSAEFFFKSRFLMDTFHFHGNRGWERFCWSFNGTFLRMFNMKHPISHFNRKENNVFCISSLKKKFNRQ